MTERPALSSSSFTCEWTYDVFLSFRGEDTRHGFTGYLYNSLNQKGIQTFIDDEGLTRGEEITPALLKAIQDSRIAIIVFSKNYASSTFCLDELVKILECLMVEGRLVLPVFYDVDPSQVRHQTGSYAEALAKHEERFLDDKDKVQKWRKALCQAANFAGWHFQHGSQKEYKLIIEIVEVVFKKINRLPLHVAVNPVGLDYQVLKVTSLLQLGSDEGVKMVGIYGIGGIGKTTIACAMYNLIADQFEGLCFLANIREKALNNHGLVQLQETLLSDLLGEEDIKVGDVDKGIPIIKRRLQQKKILLVLDDVDKLRQLQVLAGGDDWFGSGSKIIITTRDKHLLVTHGVVKLHEVELLNDEKAHELFSWHAFRSETVDPSHVDISNRAVFYAHGLPLALEVIGSHLFGKSLQECNSALDKYKIFPHKEILEILKVSYDGLEEDEKGIFLDIACFYNSCKMFYVKEMLRAHGFHVENGIRVLADKSLIKIDDSDCVRMHDLIQDMGKEIIRQESTSEPSGRSRLWLDNDIVHVLEENTKGTDKIEVIMLDLCNNKEVQWSGKAFKKMKNLRILIIKEAVFSGGPQHLPNNLRVLHWSGYPPQSLPFDFNPKELTELHIGDSCLQSFQPLKRFESISSIDFNNCEFLTELPSLCEVPFLWSLCLDNCTNLVKIHGSVGFHDNLFWLSAIGCTQLEILVPCIKLTSLTWMALSGCVRLKSFPEVLGKMENIHSIWLDRTSIDKLPLSIGNLVGLKRLSLMQCKRLNQLPSSIHTLPEVKVAAGFHCNQVWFPCFEDKLSSEVSPRALVAYNKGLGFTYLDVYYSYMNYNNVIQVTSPSPLEHPDFEFLFNELDQSGPMARSRKSSINFWFRKKFPKIALCCVGQPDMHVNNSVLYFKFSLLINDTKQFSCSCNYVTWDRMSGSQILLCDLQCKAEGIFSEKEWNQVEILCELIYPISGGCVTCGCVTCFSAIGNKRKMATGTMKWTLIYVYEEGNSKEDIEFNNPMSGSPSSLTPSCLYYYEDS